VSLKRVYLDQRDWIKLGRQHYGLDNDEGIAGVLAMVREASRAGFASFPLSSSHYIETYHHRDPGRRQRLGAFMAEISRFHTIATAPDLLDAELHVALCRLAGMEPRHQPVPFGRGARHAFGKSMPTYFSDPDLERRVIAHHGEEAVFAFFEAALISGPDEQLPASGMALPSREFAQRQLDFEHDTTRRINKWGHTRDHAHRLVLTQEMTAMLDQFNEAAEVIGFGIRPLGSGEALTRFMLSLPAKGNVCRMRMSGHENRNFRWQIGDLSDMTALGTAAGYCDVVVAEKQWGDILRRHAGELRAKVTSNLLDLPRLLLG
jgi:hypothetical protein